MHELTWYFWYLHSTIIEMLHKQVSCTYLHWEDSCQLIPEPRGPILAPHLGPSDCLLRGGGNRTGSFSEHWSIGGIPEAPGNDSETLMHTSTSLPPGDVYSAGQRWSTGPDHTQCTDD